MALLTYFGTDERAAFAEMAAKAKEAITGAPAMLAVDLDEVDGDWSCEACDGMGNWTVEGFGDTRYTCEACGGTGSIRVVDTDMDGMGG